MRALHIICVHVLFIMCVFFVVSNKRKLEDFPVLRGEISGFHMCYEVKRVVEGTPIQIVYSKSDRKNIQVESYKK